MILPINHIKTSSVNKDTITSTVILYQILIHVVIEAFNCIRNALGMKTNMCNATSHTYLTIKEMFHMIIKRDAE